MTCQSSPYAIETAGLTRKFGDRIAVNDLCLQVDRDQIYGFLGANGAGKTTTIRMLLGLIRPDSGNIALFGENFDRTLLRRVGSLVEMPSLYPHLTGRENLEVTRRLIGAPRANIDRALAIVRLVGDEHRLVREYSLGMKQRLGIALALLNEPDLLILDEPTNGLDPAGIHEIRELLRNMRSDGLTVFLSSHLLSEVEQLADSIGIIDRGNMIFQGSLAELHRLQSRRLRIGVECKEAVAALLQSSGYSAYLDGAFIIAMAPDADFNRINRLLLENGHDIFHLSAEEESLEDIFLSLTTVAAA